jgi:hypothetical protein
MTTLPITARGQEVLSPNGIPDHGGIALGIGFSPDPLPIAGILAGGGLDVAQLNMGAGCRGYVTAQPDYRINVTYPFKFLRLIFVADSLLNDTAMIVRSPGGTYTCSDNAFNVSNPVVDYHETELGEFNIWLAAIAPNSAPQGTLYVTVSEAIYPSSTGLIMPFAGPIVTPTPAGISLPTSVPGTFMDEQASPMLGTVLLEQGFLPDPYWAVMVAGGALTVPPHDLQGTGDTSAAQCGGYTSSAPHIRLNWRGLSTRLRLFFVPASPLAADTGIVVQGPRGWMCNRSFAPGFVDPLVEFINPMEGIYNVWVTNENLPDELVSGVLYITEKEYYPTYVPRVASAAVTFVEGLDSAAPPDQGSAEVGGDFEPDPLVIPMIAGGNLDIAAVNPAIDTRSHCLGYLDATPDFAFNLVTPLTYLRLFFLADDPAGDATLIVRAADGQWFCNDDSFDAVHPTISLVGVQAGTYQLWLGSYGASESIPGALYITQTDATPLRPEAGSRIGFPALQSSFGP